MMQTRVKLLYGKDLNKLDDWLERWRNAPAEKDLEIKIISPPSYNRDAPSEERWTMVIAFYSETDEK